jgi:hypothetical protein
MKSSNRLTGEYTMLMVHVEEHNLTAAKKILKTLSVAQINSKNSSGNTALSISIKVGDLKMAKLLLRFGANPNCSNNAGQSCIFIACWHNRLSILHSLAEAGGDINQADERGWTPLMVATSKGYTHIVKFLIDRGAEVEKVDKFGKKAVDRVTNEESFFMLTSRLMWNRMKDGMNIGGDLAFGLKSLEVVNSEKKWRKNMQEIEFDDQNTFSSSVERQLFSERITPQTTKSTSKKLKFEEKAIVDGVFRKNLGKLKKQFVKLGNKAVEDNVMNEVLDNKNEMMNKIEIAIEKMSKKMFK